MISAFLCFVSLLLASNKWQCWSHPKFTCFDRCLLALLITVFWIWSSRSGRSACCCGNSWPGAPRLTPMWTPSTSLSSSCKDEDCYSQSSARTHCKCTHTHTWHTLGPSLWPPNGTPKGQCVNTSVKQRAIVKLPQIQSCSSSSSKLLSCSALHDYLSSAHIDSPPCLYDMSQPPNILHTLPSNIQPRLWIEIRGSSLPVLPGLSRLLQDKQWKAVLKCDESLVINFKANVSWTAKANRWDGKWRSRMTYTTLVLRSSKWIKINWQINWNI